ncbi:MAG: hypothetical protein ABSG72_14830, partial [Candidatus Sulfotelmatobacter sp.]
MKTHASGVESSLHNVCPDVHIGVHVDANVDAHPGAHSAGFARHPKASQARILLSSVFGPYAQDDDFGSRSINPMELYHNQVTRAQG